MTLIFPLKNSPVINSMDEKDPFSDTSSRNFRILGIKILTVSAEKQTEDHT